MISRSWALLATTVVIGSSLISTGSSDFSINNQTYTGTDELVNLSTKYDFKETDLSNIQNLRTDNFESINSDTEKGYFLSNLEIESRDSLRSLLHIFELEDYDEIELEEKVSNWFNNNYDYYATAVRALSYENYDQVVLSDFLIFLFELDSDETLASRRKFAFALLTDSRSKIRYAAITGLFSLATHSDLDEIYHKKSLEKTKYMSYLYEDLINHLS